jgi:hypothetical protein
MQGLTGPEDVWDQLREQPFSGLSQTQLPSAGGRGLQDHVSTEKSRWSGPGTYVCGLWKPSQAGS